MTDLQILEVGGCVRDDLLGYPVHDYDFIVVVDSFEKMREWLLKLGFEIFVETPSTLTIRAHWPRDPKMDWFRPEYARCSADFVVPRKDGVYSDGRHPDNVSVGTVYEDLSRRDFTVNAIARDVRTGQLIDPFHGTKDLERMLLSCVGKPEDRFTEDALRIIRALRFKITKGFEFDQALQLAFWSNWIVPLIAALDINRRRDELNKCFAHDVTETLWTMEEWMNEKSMKALFAGGLWLKATQEQI